ncbi:MAG: hypothetical protein Q8920_16725 [Bacillota bacterium]|nr:hypothetical protein [Bacillota bacterium]
MTDLETPTFIKKGLGNWSRKTNSGGYGKDAVRDDQTEIRIKVWSLLEGNIAPKQGGGVLGGNCAQLVPP